MDSAQLYFQLCLVADEYTLFRNQMQVQPAAVTAGQMLAALERADKVMALLKKMRQREAVTFVQGQQPAPQSQTPVAVDQPGKIYLAHGATPPPPGATWVCASCKTHLVVVGPPGTQPHGNCPGCGVDLTPLVKPVNPSMTVWECTTCKSTFQVQGNVPPENCPHCKRRLR
jgi:rubrerythrin